MWAVKTERGGAVYWLTVEGFGRDYTIKPYLAWDQEKSHRMLVEDRNIALKWLHNSGWTSKKVLVRVCNP